MPGPSYIDAWVYKPGQPISHRRVFYTNFSIVHTLATGRAFRALATNPPIKPAPKRTITRSISLSESGSKEIIELQSLTAFDHVHSVLALYSTRSLIVITKTGDLIEFTSQVYRGYCVRIRDNAVILTGATSARTGSLRPTSSPPTTLLSPEVMSSIKQLSPFQCV